MSALLGKITRIFSELPGKGVFAVADGVGGLPFGAIAILSNAVFGFDSKY